MSYEEDEAILYLEEELPKLIRCLEAYLENIHDRVRKAQISPLIVENLNELEEYLMPINSTTDELSELLAKVVALLRLIRARETEDIDLIKKIDSILEQLKDWIVVQERATHYQGEYYVRYPYPYKYYEDKAYTKEQQFLASRRKALELVQNYEASNYPVDPIQYITYELALTDARVPPEQLFKEKPTEDQLFSEVAKKITEELEAERKWMEERQKLYSQIQELEATKAKIAEIKKQLLYKAIDQFIEQERKRMEGEE